MAEKVEFYRETEFKDTEIGRISKEWEIKKLSEFLHLENGKRPNIVVNGKFPVYGANGIMGYTDAYMVDDDIVIIGRVGAAGEVHLARGKIWLSDNVIYGINKNRTKIYLDFIFYVLKYTNLSRFASKTTHPIITQTILENFKVPVPPLAEQQKIAEILSTVDEAIQKTDDIMAKTERLKKGLMQELLTKGIGHTEFKVTEIGKIPKEWEVVKLENVVEIEDKYRIPVKKQDRQPGPFPYCGANGIIDYVAGYTHDGKFVLLAEDGGFFGPFENSAYIMRGKFWANNHVHILKAIEEVLISEFLAFYLNFINLVPFLTGSTRPKLTQEDMGMIPLPLPPLEEQQKIAEILSTVDKKLEILKQEKVKLERIKQWFMEELLTGRIRVRVA